MRNRCKTAAERLLLSATTFLFSMVSKDIGKLKSQLPHFFVVNLGGLKKMSQVTIKMSVRVSEEDVSKQSSESVCKTRLASSSFSLRAL